MLWEFIATLSAGIGTAGIALLLRRLFKRLPRELVPAAAGLGMLLFQIHSEYTWFAHTRALLPESARVVAAIPETAFYKPWAYVQAPVLKFAAIDSAKTAVFPGQAHWRQTNLYFFERRMSAQTWPILIDCQTGLQANLPANNQTPNDIIWHHTEYSQAIAQAICPKQP